MDNPFSTRQCFCSGIVVPLPPKTRHVKDDRCCHILTGVHLCCSLRSWQMGRASALIPPFSPVSWNHTVAVVAFSAPRMVANVDLLTPKAAACLDDILDQVNRQKRKKLFNIQMVNRYRVVGTLMRELIHTCGDTSLGPMAHLTLRLACERAATLAGVPLRRRE